MITACRAHGPEVVFTTTPAHTPIFDYDREASSVGLLNGTLNALTSTILCVVMDQHGRQAHRPLSGHQDPKRCAHSSDPSSVNPEHERFRPRSPPHRGGPPPASPSASPRRALSTRWQLYEKDFPVYKQPVEVGVFSLDSERRFFNDARQLRYFVEPHPRPNFDLRDGYKDRFVRRDDGVKEKLDHILRWILANKSKLLSSAAAAASPSSP